MTLFARLSFTLMTAALIIVSCGGRGISDDSSMADPVVDMLVSTAGNAGYLLADYRSLQDVVINRIESDGGDRELLWTVPTNAWVHQISRVSNGVVGMSYVPAPTDGSPQTYQNAGIFTLALDGTTASPQALLLPEETAVSYFNPVWTGDGRFVFYVRYDTSNDALNVTLMRYEPATGESIEIAQDGVWPRIAPNNELLTFIVVDPETQDRGLMVTDINGENAVELVSVGEYYDIDTPLFSAESTHIYFTASLAGRKVSWLDWLFGVKVAEAHADQNVPVEWLRVPVTGGEHEQLSRQNQIIVYGDIDQTGETLVFSTLAGLYSMPTTGGDFTLLSDIPSTRTLITRGP